MRELEKWLNRKVKRDGKGNILGESFFTTRILLNHVFFNRYWGYIVKHTR
jgi:hypothetical protein